MVYFVRLWRICVAFIAQWQSVSLAIWSSWAQSAACPVVGRSDFALGLRRIFYDFFCVRSRRVCQTESTHILEFRLVCRQCQGGLWHATRRPRGLVSSLSRRAVSHRAGQRGREGTQSGMGRARGRSQGASGECARSRPHSEVQLRTAHSYSCGGPPAMRPLPILRGGVRYSRFKEAARQLRSALPTVLSRVRGGEQIGIRRFTFSVLICISRESNPGHIDGNDVFNH